MEQTNKRTTELIHFSKGKGSTTTILTPSNDLVIPAKKGAR